MEKIITFFCPKLKNSSLLESIMFHIEIVVLIINIIIYCYLRVPIIVIIYLLPIIVRVYLPNYDELFKIVRYKQQEHNEQFRSFYHVNINRKYSKAYELVCEIEIFKGYLGCLISYINSWILLLFNFYTIYLLVF